MAGKTEKASAEYAPSNAQLDLEERRANENRSQAILSTSDLVRDEEVEPGREFAVEGNDLSGYVGVSPEYQNYANETEAPLGAEDSVEQDVIDEFQEGQENMYAPVGTVASADPDQNVSKDEAADTKTESTTKANTTNTPN
jgi:hypothetical protein